MIEPMKNLVAILAAIVAGAGGLHQTSQCTFAWQQTSATRDEAPVQELSGLWDAAIECPGGKIRFQFLLSHEGARSIDQGRDGANTEWTATLVNGDESIAVPNVEVSENRIRFEIGHYDSTVELEPTDGATWSGRWRKFRGDDRWTIMAVTAAKAIRFDVRPSDPSDALADELIGRWSVDFSASSDPAVGIFERDSKGDLGGTFLTTTGDYRYLAGGVQEGEIQLSCFDGAHAFLFKFQVLDTNRINGDFWSSDTWHESFSATRDAKAELPDGFRATLVDQKFRFSDFEYPDLEGKPINLGAERFTGKVRLIYVFGSWCPNCHDAADFFGALDREYKSRGLEILGIAFEHGSSFERNVKQVRKYLQRHRCDYEIVIAGNSDKATASRTFPLLDRIRAYPTTLFIDREGKVTDVYTGFSGPATGEEFLQLKAAFRSKLEELLGP